MYYVKALFPNLAIQNNYIYWHLDGVCFLCNPNNLRGHLIKDQPETDTLLLKSFKRTVEFVMFFRYLTIKTNSVESLLAAQYKVR